MKETVDRVLHERGKVPARLGARGLPVLQQINNEPNLLTRTLKTNKTYMIAALVPEPACAPTGKPRWPD